MIYTACTPCIGLGRSRIPALAAATSLAVAGCAGIGTAQSLPTTSPRSNATCSPAWPVASPDSVAAGQSVVLRDAGLPCGQFSRRQTYTVVLVAPRTPGGLPDYGHERKLMSLSVGVRGAFRVPVRLPSSVLPGSAQLGVRGPELDQRLQCPANADCGYFGAGIVIKRSS